MKTALLLLLRKWVLFQTMILLFCQAGIAGTHLTQPVTVIAQSSFFILAIPSNTTQTSFFKQLRKSLRKQTKKAGGDSSALVIIGTVLLTLVLVFFIFALSYVGAEGWVIALVAILGLTLIIWGAIALLKSIKRKKEKALIAP